MQCLTCKRVTQRFEDFTNLSLEMPTPKRGQELTFEQCINNYCISERLVDDNQYQCEACGIKCDAKKRLSLEKLPRNLIIQLKRFDYEGNKKRDDVNFPLSLTLKNFTSTSIDSHVNISTSRDLDGTSDSEIYDLYAFVWHRDMNGRNGHYESIVKDTSG